MLSHVNRIKDVMNAIEAAATIVHEFKLKEYQLLIYGSLDSDPIYANECANAIVALNLSENVTLCGLGNPSNVLPAGWVFVNSSVSEGLPLAIGMLRFASWSMTRSPNTAHAQARRVCVVCLWCAQMWEGRAKCCRTRRPVSLSTPWSPMAVLCPLDRLATWYGHGMGPRCCCTC